METTSPITISISPKFVSKTDKHLEAGANIYEAPSDKYLMVKLDSNGNEISGSEFSISVSGYKRQYSHSPLFKIKKKQL